MSTQNIKYDPELVFFKEYCLAVLPSRLLKPSGQVYSLGEKVRSLFSKSSPVALGSSEDLRAKMDCLVEAIRFPKRAAVFSSARPLSVSDAFGQLCVAFEKRLEACQSTLPEEAWRVEPGHWREKRALLRDVLFRHKHWVSSDKKELEKRIDAQFCRDKVAKSALIASIGFYLFSQIALQRGMFSPRNSTLLFFAYVFNFMQIVQNQDFLPAKIVLKIHSLFVFTSASRAVYQVTHHQKPLANCSLYELDSMQRLFSTLFNAASPSVGMSRVANALSSWLLIGYAFYSGVVAPVSRWTFSLFSEKS